MVCSGGCCNKSSRISASISDKEVSWSGEYFRKMSRLSGVSLLNARLLFISPSLTFLNDISSSIKILALSTSFSERMFKLYFSIMLSVILLIIVGNWVMSIITGFVLSIFRAVISIWLVRV